MAWHGRQSMRLCRDIATRYKHLTFDSPEKFDKDWSIWLNLDERTPLYFVTANGKEFPLWELMMDCIAFWEEAAAAYHLDHAKPKVFRPG